MKHFKLTIENKATAQEPQKLVLSLKTAPPNLGFVK
jgi:hypothetical protein